jgi:hypothetical protein
LLDPLLTLLRARLDLLLSRWPRTQSGRWARARRCGDLRGRTLRRRSPTTVGIGPAKLGSWPCDARRGRTRWCGDLRRGTRRHGWALRRGSRTERRCGRARHCRRRCRARHGRRRCRTGHGGRCRRSGHGRRGCRRSGRRPRPTGPTPFPLLGGRADARRDHGNTEEERRKPNATRKHGRSSQVLPPPTPTRERRYRSAGFVRYVGFAD